MYVSRKACECTIYIAVSLLMFQYSAHKSTSVLEHVKLNIVKELMRRRLCYLSTSSFSDARTHVHHRKSNPRPRGLRKNIRIGWARSTCAPDIAVPLAGRDRTRQDATRRARVRRLFVFTRCLYVRREAYYPLVPSNLLCRTILWVFHRYNAYT